MPPPFAARGGGGNSLAVGGDQGALKGTGAANGGHATPIYNTGIAAGGGGGAGYIELYGRVIDDQGAAITP